MAADLDRLVKLFLTQQDSEELHERHIAAIHKLCENNAAGFQLRDLPRVVQVLEVCLDLLAKGSSLFLEPTCSLIRTLAKPYSKRSSTDELKLLGIITGLLKTLACVLRPGVPQQLQQCTAELLADFSSAYNNRPSVLELGQEAGSTADLQSAQRLYHTHQSMLCQSDIAPAVIAALQAALHSSEQLLIINAPTSCSSRVGSSPVQSSSSRGSSAAGSNVSDPAASADAANALVAALVSALLNFSYSRELSEQLLQHSVLPPLVRLLQKLVSSSSSAAGEGLVTQVVELLWNLLELAPAAAQEALSNSSSQSKIDAQASQQQQQQHQKQQHAAGDDHPWPSSASSAAAADIWVRQSCCNSMCNSRPASGSTPYLPVSSDISKAAVAGGSVVNTAAASRAGTCVAAASASGSACATAGSAVVVPVSPAGQPSTAGDSSQTAAVLVEVLASLFKQQLQNTSSKQAKEQRNDTLAVLHHISSIPSCCTAICSSSLLPVALAAATTPELQPSSQHIPAGALTKEDADHEMKLLVWGILGNAGASSSACLAAVGTGLLRVLLLVVDEVAGRSCFAVGRWNPEQLLALRRTAWSVLQQVAPLCKAEFCSCGGVTALVRHISCCYNSNSAIDWTPRGSSPGGRNNSIGAIATNVSLQTSFVSGGGGSFSSRSSSSSIEPALRLLARLVAGDASMADAFAEQGLIPALLQLLQAPVCVDAAGAKQGVLLVLAEMCAAGGAGCIHKLRQAEGVGLLLKECQDVLESDPSLPSLGGLAALDCLWRCCLPSARCRAQLLALDGMDVLLGLLLKGNRHLRPVVLSILADLLTDQRSHPFFLEWHAPAPQVTPSSGTSSPTPGGGSSGTSSDTASGTATKPPSSSSAVGQQIGGVITAAQLLIAIWREQDQATGLSGPNGLLANPARPLAGSGGRTKWAVGEAGVGGGYGVLQPGRRQVLQRIAEASCPDLLLDKVYACFAQIGFDSLEGQLPPADAAVLAFIQAYVKFRQGEVWQDIQAEFEAAGLTPTHEDSVRVLSGIQHSELIASQVQEAQAALLAAVSHGQLAAERAMYDAMLAQAAADAKAKVWEKDSSKLTMRERLAAKARKEEMLKHSIHASLRGTAAAAAAVGLSGDGTTGICSSTGMVTAAAGACGGGKLAADCTAAAAGGRSLGNDGRSESWRISRASDNAPYIGFEA